MATTPESPSVPDEQPSDPMSHSKRNAPWLVFGLFVAAGLLAGFQIDVTLGVNGFFEVPAELRRTHAPPPPELAVRIDAAETKVKYQNAAWTFGLAGLLFGLAGGAVSGSVERNVWRVVAGSGSGAVLGMVSGIAGGLLAMYIHMSLGLVEDENIFYKAISVHGAGWGTVGVGVGLAVALPLREKVSFVACLGGIAVAALMSALLYAPIAAIVFPLEDSTDQLAPSGTVNRIVWTSVTALLMGFAVVSTLTPSRRKQPVALAEKHPTVS